ncbi:MAG: LacI family DNA-binding transcriptional regulator, partial [Propionibacteriaceae bacterium]|nr:LacI family DNA-binding transcriptional regulator [Propionibacteriaceae bacterium]
ATLSGEIVAPPSAIGRSRMITPPTSNDVARLAGVAQSTVSYVLTGKGRVSDETRERVLQAAAQLNYQPNAGAQALRSRKSRVLGLMFPVRTVAHQPGRLRFLTTVVAACREQGYDALVVTADEGPEGLRRLAGTALCDGLLVMEVKDQEPLTEVAGDLRVPTVFVGAPTHHDTVICVARDYAKAGALCVSQLADAGARRISLLPPASEYFSTLNFHKRFIRGMYSEAEARQVAVAERPVDSGFLDLHRGVGEVLAATHPPDGIVASPAVDAADVIASLLLHGRRPGGDVSFVGVSDDATQRVGSEGLAISHAFLNGTELARRSVARLLELIEGTPDHLLAGDVDLIPPAWVPGATLVSSTARG